MEGFRQEQLGLIDDWLHAEKGSDNETNYKNQIRDYLNRRVNDGHTEKYMDLLQAIKNAGMRKVLCIEGNNFQMTDTGDGRPVGLTERDGNWEEVVSQYLSKTNNSRVLVFAGAPHFMHDPVSEFDPSKGTFAQRISADKRIHSSVDLTPPPMYDAWIKIWDAWIKRFG
jgi:hypothetical protein